MQWEEIHFTTLKMEFLKCNGMQRAFREKLRKNFRDARGAAHTKCCRNLHKSVVGISVARPLYIQIGQRTRASAAGMDVYNIHIVIYSALRLTCSTAPDIKVAAFKLSIYTRTSDNDFE